MKVRNRERRTTREPLGKIRQLRRRLVAGPSGDQGNVTQVSWRCSAVSRDMKSYTAKEWCSMKVVTSLSVCIRS